MQTIIATLVSEMAQMPVIDAHEHIVPEEEATRQTADVFNRILCHYSLTVAESAGMAGKRDYLHDTSVPLDERWQVFRPYLPAILDSGHARAAAITARDLYGIEEINDGTYQLLSDRLQAANTPGLFDEVLKKHCRIETVLNQVHGSELLPEEPCTDHEREGFFRFIYRGLIPLQNADAKGLKELLRHWQARHGGPFADAQTLAAFMVTELSDKGYAGIKFHAPMAEPCDDATAESLFRKMVFPQFTDNEAALLGAWLVDRVISFAPQRELPVAIHLGMNFCCWAPVAPRNPMLLEPFLLCHRDTVFDLYHAAMPWVRESAVLGNQLPNVHLNLVWCHQISPYMTQQMLNEWIDMVPANKIIGFGGDNCFGPEKTYGVLKMAQENIARALAVRIERGEMSESRAVDVCRMWLYENPKRIYRL
jgi:predicted TIM-barrel fold metal-dependent hydrolase